MHNDLDEKRVKTRFTYTHQFTSLIMGDMAGLPDKPFVDGEIIDISNGGLGIYCDSQLKTGVVLLVRIPVSGTEASIPVLMSVQWAEKNGNGWHAGLKFVINQD